MVHQAPRRLARKNNARSISRNRKFSGRREELRREEIYRLRDRRALSRGSKTTPEFVGEADRFVRAGLADETLTASPRATRRLFSPWPLVPETSRATSLIFPAGARPARRCGPLPALLPNSRQQTFP